jgi:isocitrate lyase
METPTPTVELAVKFGKMVHKYHPRKFLSYNCSPSFNWSAFGYTDE